MLKEKLKVLYDNFNFKAKALKNETAALYLACKRPDVPFYAKAVIVLVVGYALSPIDLIPDFIPVLGYLDDLILVPAGIALSIKLIPEPVMNECRQQSEDMFRSGKPKSWAAAMIIVLVWISILCLILYKIFLQVGIVGK